MRVVLHTTKITNKLLLAGAFSEVICAKFAILLDENEHSVKRALAKLMACEKYDRRVSFQGLGGGVVIPLELLLQKELSESAPSHQETPQSAGTPSRQRSAG